MEAMAHPAQPSATGPRTFVNPARPRYHYTPPNGWMNDPNGLVYFEGEYHLFYQARMPSHWGHAVGDDLLHWTDLPIAMAPDERGAIASGSCVVDWDDTSGFFGGKPGLVAIFTHWLVQEQSIAYTTDRGRTWTKYAGNPVVENPAIPDFRDPKVIWHAPTQRWVMVLAVADRVHFYVSPNLRVWAFASEFGAQDGAHSGVWECPDLVEISVDGISGLRKWTLHISVNVRHGRIMQYYVGEFDGTHFVNDNDPATTLWTDGGADYYASVTWATLAPGDERRVWLGWMSNWTYAKQLPTEPWQGMMSIPRRLGLKETNDGIRLYQEPIVELRQLRGSVRAWSNEVVAPGQSPLGDVRGRSVEIVAELEPGEATALGFHVRMSDTERTTVRYDRHGRTISVARGDAGLADLAPGFAGTHTSSVALSDTGTIKLQIFLDECSIEVFANDGEAVISDLIFPARASDSLEVFSEGGEALLKSLSIYWLAEREGRLDEN